MTDTVLREHVSHPDRPVSLEDLKATLLGVQGSLASSRDRLSKLVSVNMDALKWYDSQTKAVLRAYHQFSAQLGDLSAAKVESARIGQRQFPLPEKAEFMARKGREIVLSQVHSLVHSKDFDKEAGLLEGFSWKTRPMSFSLMVSRKTNKLLALLVQCNTELALLAANHYIQVTLGVMKSQLESLPHFAALFYNDCQFLSYALLARGAKDDRLLLWNSLGSAVLDSQVARQVAELEAILEHADELASAEKASAQALMRVGQLTKLWQGILDTAMFTCILAHFEQLILEWYWEFVSNLDCISEEVIGRIKSLTALVVSESFPANTEIKTRIKAYVGAMDMSLMQLTNTARRGGFEGVLEPAVLYHLVESLFEDSRSRQACLRELHEDGTMS